MATGIKAIIDTGIFIVSGVTIDYGDPIFNLACDCLHEC
jgi:hypothetical protein